MRAEGPQKLPADFQLIMAANSCPCGRLGFTRPAEYIYPDDPGLPQTDVRYLTDNHFQSYENFSSHACFCSPDDVNRYWRKMGSALLDRIELRVPVRTPGVLLPEGGGEEGSAEIRRRVIAAVRMQSERFKGLGVRRNARMSPGHIEKFCRLSGRSSETFNIAAEKLCLSGRACHGILKLARTIADLEGKDSIDTVHILEAVQHRRFGDDPYDILTANS